MDEHGLPIVGSGVDYTKVSLFTISQLLPAVHFLGSSTRTQEHTRTDQPIYCAHNKILESLFISLWRSKLLWTCACTRVVCWYLQRLSDLCMRLQRLDISLSILESKVHTSLSVFTLAHPFSYVCPKLASIEGLDGVQATTQYEPPAAVAAAGSSGITTSQPTSSSAAAPKSQQAAPAAPPPPGVTNEPIPPPQPQVG